MYLQILQVELVGNDLKSTMIWSRRCLFGRRTNIGSLACAVDMSASTMFRRFKEGDIRAYTNAIKPHLTENKKKARLEFCLSMIESSTLHSNPIFLDMFNYVHIDEKWFFLAKKKGKVLSSPRRTRTKPL